MESWKKNFKELMNKEKVREDKEEVLEQEVAKMKEDIEVDEEENGS